MDVVRLDISELAGADNLAAIEAAIRTVPGVLSVHADPAGHAVDVHVAPTVTGDEIVAAVTRAGYVATIAG